MWLQTLLSAYLLIPWYVFLVIACELVAIHFGIAQSRSENHHLVRSIMMFNLFLGAGGSFICLNIVARYYFKSEPQESQNKGEPNDFDDLLFDIASKTFLLTVPLLALTFFGMTFEKEAFGQYAMVLASAGGAIVLIALIYKCWQQAWVARDEMETTESDDGQ